MNKINFSKGKLIFIIMWSALCQGLQFTVSPVLDDIQKYYSHINVNLIQMIITAPALMSMIIAVTAGWLVLKISKKKLLFIGCLITGLAGFLPLLNDSFALLFASRIIYGIGLGLAVSLNGSIIAEFTEGNERTQVMGIQGAFTGLGMMLSTSLGGFLGGYGFTNVYYIHIIGIVAALVILKMLPDTGKVVSAENGGIKLTKGVFKIALLGFLELLFLISFSTNISMHVAGNTSISGILTGVFSGIQIIAGICLGYIARYTGKYTLSVAMIIFSAGAFLLVLFSNNLAMLIVGSALCGISQGFFMPQATSEITYTVKPAATTMAIAGLNVATSTAQLLSPMVLNGMASLIFGGVATSNVFIIAAIGMVLSAIIAFVMMGSQKKTV